MSGSARNLWDEFEAQAGQAAPSQSGAAPEGSLWGSFEASQKASPAPQPSPEPQATGEDPSLWKIALNALTKGALGVADLAGTAAQVATPGQIVGRQAERVFHPERASVASPMTVTGQPIAPTVATDIAQEAGAINYPGSAPQTRGQRYLAAAAEGLGGAAPLTLLSGGVAPAFGMLAQGVGGGIGGEAGNELTGGKPWGRIGGDVLGGLAAGSLASGAVKAGNALAGNSGPVVAAYDAAGVKPRLMASVAQGSPKPAPAVPTTVNMREFAGPVTYNAQGAAPVTPGSKTAATMQDVAASLPGGTGRITNAANETVNEFGAAVNKAADAIGGAPTRQAAGEIIQQGAQDWLSGFNTKSTDLWNRFWNLLPPGTISPMTNTRQVAQGMGEQLKQLPGMADALSTDQWKAIRASVAKAGDVDVATLKAFRTAVGQQLEGAALVSNPATGDLKRLYGALTDDIKDAAVQKGAQNVVAGMVRGAPAQAPSPLAAFNEANDYTRAGHQLIEHTVSRIYDKTGAIAPEKAYEWAIQQGRSGDTRFENLRTVTPTGANAAAGTKLREMAAPAARSPGELAGGPVASPAGFNTAWNQLSPEGRAAMFRGVPNINALATVAGREAAGRGAENTSRTAHTLAYQDWLKSMAALAGAGGGALIGGSQGITPGAMSGYLTATAGMPIAGAALARAMTSPSLNRIVAAPGTGLSAYQRSALAALLAQHERERR